MQPIRQSPLHNPLPSRWKNEGRPCHPAVLHRAFASRCRAGYGCPHLGEFLEAAFGDAERTCAVITMIDREIASRSDDESLRTLRIAAYGLLADPYSAMPDDVAALAVLHPGDPPYQLQKCMDAEATGAPQEKNRLRYLRVARLCRQSGKADAHSHECLLALLLADSPEAEEAKRRFLAALTDSPMNQALKDILADFAREKFVKKSPPRRLAIPACGSVDASPGRQTGVLQGTAADCQIPAMRSPRLPVWRDKEWRCIGRDTDLTEGWMTMPCPEAIFFG